MAKFKFQNQANDIITMYQDGKSFADIARALNCIDISKDSQNIRRLLLSKLDSCTKGHPKIVITDDLKIKIKELLDSGKKPKQISDELDINVYTLSWYLRNLGLKFRPSPGNINYFNTIDTHAKAYILGFIAADGALVSAKKGPTITLTITIKYEDKAVLDFIKSEIGNTHNLLEIIRPSSFNPAKEIHHIRLAFSTPQIVSDIQKYGITPKKSLTLGNIIENIPYEFRDSFILGYFDADGSVMCRDGLHQNSKNIFVNNYSLYIQLRGTRAFLTGICNHLNIGTNHIHEHGSIPQLSFANKKDVYRFYQCYNNLPFYYKRKHDIFLKRINHPSFDKYKQDQTISSSVE